ncbi:MAG: hypothetical protein HY647_12350 [Acidobacteria bacterium]|nr:hypothetical protein [Acidobacteriota bacterium]
MADLIYLSLWLKDFHLHTMFPHWKSALEQFPASSGAPGAQSLTIYPLDWGQTPLLEQAFPPVADATQVVSLANEFLHEDCAYEAQMRWDLWVLASDANRTGWQKVQQVVSVACLGSRFDPEAPENRGNLQINFGLDTPFLPPVSGSTPNTRPPFSARPAQENLQQLLDYVHRLEQKLPLLKKLLWCESGENWAEKISTVWNLKP